MRHVVAQAIAHAAAHGLPGDHHFYLTFRTDHSGVVMPPRLRAQYPQEMTIVLQHQFWDLKMDQEAGVVSVGLSFGGVTFHSGHPFGCHRRLCRSACALWHAVPPRSTGRTRRTVAAADRDRGPADRGTASGRQSGRVSPPSDQGLNCPEPPNNSSRRDRRTNSIVIPVYAGTHRFPSLPAIFLSNWRVADPVAR